MKPRVKAGRVNIVKDSKGLYVAMLDRLSDHPRLGPPRTESQTRTSVLIRADFMNKEIETPNTIYYWED